MRQRIFLFHLKNKTKVIFISSYMCWRLLDCYCYNFLEHSINIQYKYNISVKHRQQPTCGAPHRPHLPPLRHCVYVAIKSKIKDRTPSVDEEYIA